MAGPEDPNNGAGFSPVATKTETLRYLCEIIYDLKLMADKSGYKTLAAILNAALVEARLQSDEAEH